MKLYFLRHGEAEHNAQKLLGGLHDTALTSLGRQQAIAGSKKVQALGIDVIYASPLLRAKETGEIVADEINLELIVDPRIVERSVGVLEGTPSAHTSVSTTPDNTTGAETIAQLRERAINFLDDINTKHQDQTVLVVSHGAFIKMLISIQTQTPWEQIKTITLPHAEPFRSTKQIK